jgi:hypothetical protein
MHDDDTLDFLQLLGFILLIVVIVVVVIKSLGLDNNAGAEVGTGLGVLSTGLLSINNMDNGIEGGNANNPRFASKSTSVSEDLQFGTNSQVPQQRKERFCLGSGKDEYDSSDVIKEIDTEFVYDNMIVDGNNFLHRLYEFENPGAKNPDTGQRFKYLEKSIKLLYEEIPNRKIFFVLKDPDVHEKDVMEYLHKYTGETIRTKFKAYFKKLLSKYPNVRVVMAYGQAKSRDDFTCIHLANILGRGTVLLSRDRYRDIVEIDAANTKVNIVVYGKQSATWTKKFKKPFMYADKATVVESLVGFTFSHEAITMLYKKYTSKHSAASDRVLNLFVS